MKFLDVLLAISQNDIDFIIVGGIAARLHGSTRLTQDIDIVPRLEKESWTTLIQTISQLNMQPRISETIERISDIENIRKWMIEKNMPALSFRSPRADVEIDLLISESDRFDDLLANASIVTFQG